MFCQNCGSKIDDGVRFCIKCGAQIATAEAVKGEEAKPKPNAVSGTGNTGRNKLIHTAAIVALGIWFGYSAVGFYLNFLKPYPVDYTMIDSQDGLSIEQREQLKELFDQDWAANNTFGNRLKNGREFFATFIFLASLAIPIALSFVGWKKNNRTMVLIAGMVYIWMLLGIPSGIMCFIAFSKMKRPT